jgi:DNA-binding HxlR family transcriptional regulator
MGQKNEGQEKEGICTPKTKLARGLLLLQEKWVLFIINGLLDGPKGFNELSRRAHGVNTTTLSQRMELLEKEGIVVKTNYLTIPPRTSYELTQSGKALHKVIQAIAEWTEEHLPDPDAISPSAEEVN